MLQNLKELYAYRVLIYHLVIRELKVRYRGSVLGFLWTFLNPLLLMVTYSVVFMFYLRVEMEAYAAFLLTGLLPWVWFQTSVSDGAGSIVGRRDLLSKVKFPPQVLPTVVVTNHFINFIFSLPLLLLFAFYFRRPLGWSLVALPLVWLVEYVFCLAVAHIVGALTVPFRDLLHIITNLLNLWFFATPIIYPEEMIPAKLKITVHLNPMAPVIRAYQDIIYHGRWPQFDQLALFLLFALVVFAIACEIFNHYRDDFAEVI